MFYIFSADIYFRRQNLTSIDVKLWRVKSIPTLKRLKGRICHCKEAGTIISIIIFAAKKQSENAKIVQLWDIIKS